MSGHSSYTLRGSLENETRRMTVPTNTSRMPRPETPRRRLIATCTSGKAAVARERGVHLPATAAPPLDHDRGQVRLLHGPHTLDELRDGDAVRFADSEHDEAL